LFFAHRSLLFYPPRKIDRVTTRKLSFLAGLAALFIALFLTACDNGATPNNGAENQTPVATDYDVTGLSQIYDGNPKELSISPKVGKSNGAISVFYIGTEGTNYAKSETAPSAKGKYAVTFDVAAATGWNAASNLSAGTMEISEQIANPKTPTADDYTFGNLIQTVGRVSPVTITPKGTASPGVVSNIKYDGSTTIPPEAGTYAVTFDVAAASGWNAAMGLNAGTLAIITTEVFNSVTEMETWLDDQPANTSATPYDIALELSDLGDSSFTNGSIGNILKANDTKYVNLYLSGSTITSIEERAFTGCTSLASVTIGNSVASITSVTFEGTITSNFSPILSFPGN
jgi:hypothetical protein